MKRLLMVLVLGGCTYGATSGTPMDVAGVGAVYKYQGRANFPHQIAEADKMMAAQCQRVNGGHPVIVSQQVRNIGMGGILNSNSITNANGSITPTYGGAALSGQARTAGFGTISTMANQNQEIYYRCDK